MYVAVVRDKNSPYLQSNETISLLQEQAFISPACFYWRFFKIFEYEPNISVCNIERFLLHTLVDTSICLSISLMMVSLITHSTSHNFLNHCFYSL